MKKLVLSLYTCCFVFFAKAQNNTTIHGTITGLEPGRWVYWNAIGNSLQKDSVQTQAGSFEIGMNIPEGEGDAYILRIGSKYVENGVLMIYLENGKVEIKGEGPLFKDAKLSGGPSIGDYNDYRAMIDANPELKGRMELYKKANGLYSKNDSAGLAALRPQLDRVDSIDKALTKQWIARHPSSPVSAFLLSRQLNELSFDEKERMLNSLTDAARNNAPAKRIAASIRINNLTGIGKAALDFTQNDTLDRPVSLRDFRGKYVLVDFWASWCKPCRAENPNVVAAYNKYKDRNFTVLSVSLDQPNGREKWLKAIHDDGLMWTHVSDLQFWNNAVAKQYDIGAIPANILVGPDGKILAKDLHEGELDKKLGEVLQSQAFSLNGTIRGAGEAPHRLYLSYEDKDDKRVQDSSRVDGGRFEFHGAIAEPTMAYLYDDSHSRSMDEKHSTGFFLESAAMTISIPAGNFEKSVVAGSQTQQEYEALKRMQDPLDKEMEPLERVYTKASEEYLAAVKAHKDEATVDTLKYRAAAIHDQFDPYHARRAQIDYAFFALHPQSYVTAFMLRFHTGELSLDSLRLFYQGLGPVVQASSSGKKIAEELENLQAGWPGSMAKDFSVAELNGGTLSLSALKGKYVLIDFWASWCVPCRKSMPHIRELYALYKHQGLEVIGVSDDDRDSVAWKKAVEKDGTGVWHNVLRGFDYEKMKKNEKNDHDISEKFGIHSLPTKILIDKDGRIIGRYGSSDEEAEALNKKLATIL